MVVIRKNSINCTLSEKKVIAGVPQKTMLAPMLFIKHVDDLASIFKEGNDINVMIQT